MNITPITCSFSSNLDSKVTFSVTNNANLSVSFKATYRQGKGKERYTGEGYTGEIISNDLL